MSEGRKEFHKGDWIVHPNYGVGKIKKIEEKRLSGRRMKYYRVEAEETAYWIPLDGIEECRARKVIGQAELRSAVRLLERPSKQMDSNYRNRRSRINKVVSEGLLRPTVRLVRDLWARNREKRLNDTEKAALRRIMDSLVDEWAIAESISTESANAQLNELLENNQSPEGSDQALTRLGRLTR